MKNGIVSINHINFILAINQHHVPAKAVLRYYNYRYILKISIILFYIVLKKINRDRYYLKKNLKDFFTFKSLNL